MAWLGWLLLILLAPLGAGVGLFAVLPTLAVGTLSLRIAPPASRTLLRSPRAARAP